MLKARATESENLDNILHEAYKKVVVAVVVVVVVMAKHIEAFEDMRIAAAALDDWR